MESVAWDLRRKVALGLPPADPSPAEATPSD